MRNPFAEKAGSGYGSRRFNRREIFPIVRSYWYPLDWHYPAVAPTRQGLNVSRLVGGIPKSYSQSLDCRVDAVFKLDNGVVWPEVLLNLLPRDDVAWPLQKHREDPKRLLGQLDSLTGTQQLPGAKVGFIGLEADQVGRLRGFLHIQVHPVEQRREA